MGFIKSILILAGILALIWIGVGIYIGYFTEHMADIPRFQIVLESPIHAWHIIKDYVTSI